MRISNYRTGKIYAIVDRNETVVYIGTTVSTLYRAWLNIKTRIVRKPPCLQDPLHSHLYRNKHHKHTMILVEHHTCHFFYQLENRADKYVSIFDPIVNRIKKHQNKFKRETGIKKTKVQCPCCVNNREEGEIRINLLGQKNF